MKYRGYNDYELLYLYHSGVEEALEIMLDKYEKMIYNRIHKFSYLNQEFDDTVQECKFLLYRTIQKFNELENKTFTRFFELVLEHRLIDLYRQEKKQISIKNDLMCFEYNLDFDNEYSLNTLILKEKIDEQYFNLSSFEKKVYQYKFIEKLKVRDISRLLNNSPIKISNAIQRIKRKIL